jgi:hypothetical protein
MRQSIPEAPQRLIGRTVCEQKLPVCVRDVLQAARAAQPETDVTCIAFHTLDSGRAVTRMGPDTELIDDQNLAFLSRLRPKDLLVLSVTVTETTFETVHTVTHVLVARKERRPSTSAA